MDHDRVDRRDRADTQGVVGGSNDRRPRPPFATDLLIDYHSGSLDDDVAAHVRAGLAADPDARRILAALDATNTDLESLRGEEIPIPSEVRDRMIDVIRRFRTD